LQKIWVRLNNLVNLGERQGKIGGMLPRNVCGRQAVD
jgi:hypothetical protein